MKTLRRGCRIFFYVSGPGHGKVIGSAILRRTAQGTPKKLHARHGGLGAWKLDEIVGHTKGKDAMAYVFDWFQRFAQDVPLNRLKAIRPGYNPITAMAISHAQGDAIVSEGTTT